MVDNCWKFLYTNKKWGVRDIMPNQRPYKQILDFLMELIKQISFEPNYKLPSERMLAVKFNASRRSTRLAYDQLLSQGLVHKIHGKGYFTTGSSIKKETAHHANSKKIFFIVPALRTRFMQNILYGITDFCDEHTIDVSIKLTKSDVRKEAQYIHSALSSDTKGIILFPIDNERINEGLLKLSTQRYPLVIIDRYFTNINSSFISTDNYTAMREAVKFLHGKKHTHFLYLTSHDSLATSVSERLNGYLDGMKAYFKTSGKESVLTLHSFSFEKIYNGVRTYLQENPQTEVIITNGLQTATDAILAAANSLNLSIPQDIKLMIFDNDFSLTEMNLFRPYVILQDAYQIGYRSAASLYNQLYGDLRTEIVRLPVNIIEHTQKGPNEYVLE